MGTNALGHGVPEFTAIRNSDETELQGTVEVAAAVATVTLAAAAGKTNYLNGFRVDGLGATAASTVSLTVTGLLGGTQKFLVSVPAGATVRITPLDLRLPRPLRASAANVAIVVSMPSFGVGNTQAILAAHGHQV